MKRLAFLLLTVLVCVSFFLPWVRVQSEAVGGFSKMLTGKEQSEVAAISGFQVPILANSKDSRLMITVIKIFKPDIEHADKKSFAIWIVPLLAVLFYWLAGQYKNKLLYAVIGGIGCAIFGFAVYKIMNLDLSRMVIEVKIGYGLWLTLVGYLGIGLVNLGYALEKPKKKKA